MCEIWFRPLKATVSQGIKQPDVPAGGLAAQAFLRQLFQITVPEPVVAGADQMQVAPGKNTGVMTVVEDELDGVVANGFDF